MAGCGKNRYSTASYCKEHQRFTMQILNGTEPGYKSKTDQREEDMTRMFKSYTGVKKITIKSLSELYGLCRAQMSRFIQERPKVEELYRIANHGVEVRNSKIKYNLK